jgi:hypothetical protein
LASAVTYFVLRTGLGAVCLLAGLEKARAPKEFVEGVRQYRLVQSRFAPVVGGALIATELVLGLLLVTGLVPVLAAVGAIALFTVFGVALGVSLALEHGALPLLRRLRGREDLAARARPGARARRRGGRRAHLRPRRNGLNHA